MINMTSFANFDFFDKQNEITALDQAAGESKAKEFGELFTNFVAAPGVNTPVQPNAEFVSGKIKINANSPETNEITPDENQFVETPNLPVLGSQDVQKQNIPAEIKLELTPVEKTLIKDSTPETPFKSFADVLSEKDASPVSPFVTETPLNSDVPEPKLTAESTIKLAEQTKAEAEIVVAAENALPSLEEKPSPQPTVQPDTVFENQIQPKTNDFEFNPAVEQTKNAIADTENLIADTKNIFADAENKSADFTLPEPENKMQFEINSIKRQKVSTAPDAFELNVVIENKIKENEVATIALEENAITGNAITENAKTENAVEEKAIMEAPAPVKPEAVRNEIFSEEIKAFAKAGNPSDSPVNPIFPDAEKPPISSLENQASVEPIADRFEQPIKPTKETNFELKTERQNLKTSSIETKPAVDIELKTPVASDLKIPAVTESNTTIDKTTDNKFTTIDNKLNIPTPIESQTLTQVELDVRANSDLRTPPDVELKSARIIESKTPTLNEDQKTANDSQLKTPVEVEPIIPTNTEFDRPSNADSRTPVVTELNTPANRNLETSPEIVESKLTLSADVKPKKTADAELKTPLDVKLKTLVDIDSDKSFALESKTNLDIEFVNPKADIDLTAPTDDKLNSTADASDKTLPETETVELKTPTESFVKSSVSEKAPLPADKLISPEVKIKPALPIDVEAPVRTSPTEQPTTVKAAKKSTATLVSPNEPTSQSSDVLPVIQTSTGKFKKNVIASPIKLETFSSAANVPLKFKNLFNLSSPNTVVQDVVPASPVSSDVVPVAATGENPAEIENLSTDDLPNLFSKILNSALPENTKAVNEPTNRIAATADFQLAGEQVERQETQSVNSANDSFDAPEAAEFEKPIKLTDNSPAPFFERLSMAVRSGTQIAETIPALDVQKADVLDQIEKPLLEAVTLTAEIDEPEILKLRLRPADLGMVEVKLEKTDTNTIKIQFQTQTDATQQILAENFDQLKTSLENSGWRVEPMEIVSQQFASSGSEQQRDSQSRQRDAENKFGESTNFGSDADETSDSADSQSDRLLSMHA